LDEHEDCIVVKDLYKTYGQETHAINGITFGVRYGEIFGFIGPNGAGKTTTIKILTTLIRPSSGVVNIFGKDIIKSRQEIRKHIGIILQKPSFEPNLTVERSLDLYGILWHINRFTRMKRIKEILEQFDLQDIRHMKNEDLSIGQRRRVQIAREFIHDMKLLFLDEPTVGLDPNARRMLLDYIKMKAKEGLTVFFTTHIMEEAEYLCDRIAIIQKGTIFALDTVSEVKNRYGGNQSIEVTVNAEGLSSDILEQFKLEISESHNILLSKPNVIKIYPVNSKDVLNKIIDTLYRNGIQIENISISSSSLEEIFINITKKDNSDSNTIQ
jgi:ABC-2 type transport system ATP-binding protein